MARGCSGLLPVVCAALLSACSYALLLQDPQGPGAVAAAPGASNTDAAQAHQGEDMIWPRVKVYYVNVDSSVIRSECIRSQLEPLIAEATSKNALLHFERYSAVTFTTCRDPASCLAERPECFPTGKVGYIHHGRDGKPEEKARMIRGVLGNWCSHLLMLRQLRQDASNYDYFLVIEDDVIFRAGFIDSLLALTRNFPHNWHLVTMDTFSNRRAPDHDTWTGNTSRGLPLFALSETKNTYWGAHAWLYSSFTLKGFARWFERTPGIPLDWLTKVPHPPHIGLWAYQPSTLMQRQHVSEEEVSRLPDACRTLNGSDIIGSGEHDHVVPPVNFLMKRKHVRWASRADLQVRGLDDATDEDANVAALLQLQRDSPQEQSQEPPGKAPQEASREEHPQRSLQPLHIITPGSTSDVINRAMSAKPVREAIILGMPSSGTVMLRDLLHQHIELPRGVQLCKGRREDAAEPYCGRVWHHTHPSKLGEALAFRRGCGLLCDGLRPASEAIALVVVRHPISNIRKLQEGRSQFLACTNQTGVAGMASNCWYEEKPSLVQACGNDTSNCTFPRVPNALCAAEQLDRPEASFGQCWENLPDAWNSYTSGYQRLDQSGLFKQVLFLRYEDLVEDPTLIVHRVTHAVGLQNIIGENLMAMYRFSGNMMLNSKRRLALAKLNTLDYGARLSCPEMQALCARLNRGLFFSLGYHACQKAWPAYDELIFRGKTYEAFPKLVLEMDDWPERHRCTYGWSTPFRGT